MNTDHNIDAQLHAHAPLVARAVAAMRGRLSRSITDDELRAAALVGLWRALQRFDDKHEAGASFATFALHRMRGAMLDYVREIDAVSRHDRKLEQRGDYTPPRVLSIHSLTDDDGNPITDTFAAPAIEADVDSETLADWRATLSARLDSLDEIDATMARLYWQAAWSQAEIADAFEVSASRVNQRLRAVLRHLGVPHMVPHFSPLTRRPEVLT